MDLSSARIGSYGPQITCDGRPRCPLFLGTARLVSFPDHLALSGPGGSNDGLRDGPEREQTGSSEEQRAARTTIVGDLRTVRANPGRDPSTKRPTRPPNSRDGAVRDAAFRTKTSRRWATLRF
jgi:hypothetical protein